MTKSLTFKTSCENQSIFTILILTFIPSISLSLHWVVVTIRPLKRVAPISLPSINDLNEFYVIQNTLEVPKTTKFAQTRNYEGALRDM